MKRLLIVWKVKVNGLRLSAHLVAVLHLQWVGAGEKMRLSILPMNLLLRISESFDDANGTVYEKAKENFAKTSRYQRFSNIGR